VTKKTLKSKMVNPPLPNMLIKSIEKASTFTQNPKSYKIVLFYWILENIPNCYTSDTENF